MTEYQDLLTRAVTLRIRPSEAIRGLGAFATCSFDSNPASVDWHAPIRDEVRIEPAHVQHALREYLSGRLSAKELRDWSLFVSLVAHYRTADPPPDDPDRFDPMWDVVHDLAAPEIHGLITPELVQEKLLSLGHFQAGSDGSAA